MWLVVAGVVLVGAVGWLAVGGGGAAVVDIAAGADVADNGGDRVAWAAQFWRALGDAAPQLTGEAKLLAFAQAALESGFGTANAATRGFNAFNLTAGSTWHGPTWVQQNGDVDANGNPITQRWCIYSSWAECVADWWARFVNRPAGWVGADSYARARAALLNGDAYGFVFGLHAAGFFELAPSEYLSRLSTVLSTAKDMTLG